MDTTARPSWIDMQLETLNPLLVTMRHAMPNALNMGIITEIHHNNNSLNTCYIRLYTGLGHIDIHNRQEWLAFVSTIVNIDLQIALNG